MRRILKSLPVIGIAAIISVAGAQTAVAADEPQTATTAAIAKVLQVPEGTTVPTLTFAHDVKAVSVDDVAATPTNMPGISLADMTIDGTEKNQSTKNGVTTYYVESLDILKDVTFSHAGTYVYTVTERATTNGQFDTDTIHHTLTYSNESYKLTVYVVNTDSGLGVGAAIVETDKGKVTATPGGSQKDGGHSGMAFVSTYVHTNGPADPDNPNPTKESTLAISKAVKGDLSSDKQYFNFTVKLSAPALVTNLPEYYRAYVMDATGVISPSNNGAASLLGQDLGDNKFSFIKVSASGPTVFTLKHGQKLVFVDTPTGTSYEVSEITPTSYEPSLVVTTNAVAAKSIVGEKDETLASGQQLVGESTNTAAFTNNRTLVTPTGLSVSAAPFIGFVGLAILGLAAYVVVKSRMRAHG